jgi:hypothetical protein
MTTIEILQRVVFLCCRGSYLLSERPTLEGVHAFLCAKEINELLENKQLELDVEPNHLFATHKEGIQIVISWAESLNLCWVKEVDISIGVADVLVYADDIGIFEIGTTRPTKMILLLKYIARLDGFYTVHFWPYSGPDAFVFRNWQH